ncbi:hypothetical protein B0H11DRAFT_2222291 [Mycena galericulata]|nr:hypothetical protein B0H11DRAFT_2222291 [Mycena galericulata]
MDWKNWNSHIKSSKGHARAVERNAAQRMQLAAIQNNQEDDLARRNEAAGTVTALRDIQMRPIDGPSSYRIQSRAETELWEQISADPYNAGFDAGVGPSQQYEAMHSLWNAGMMGHDTGFSLGSTDEPILLDEDDTDEFLAEIMQNAAIRDPHIDDILNFEPTTHDERSDEWAPYASKMLFLLDTLDNLPRLRISNSLMKVFLWILKEGGAKDVPSFDHLRKVQKALREKCGVPTTQYKSAKGNIFHMNDPRTIIAKDWANPETRKFIHVYPEIPEDGVIREIWHAQKWRKDMDLDSLSPMYAAGHCHYYVNELALLKTGKFVIPIRWIQYKRAVCADAFEVIIDPEGSATVLDTATIFILASDLQSNFLDLEDERRVPIWSEEARGKGYPARMPNPKRALAQGDRMYSSLVDYFGDDVSGNRSKSWNKHWNAYMTHRNLPRHLLQQEYHVHFISTSPNASITEQFMAFKSVVESTHTNPIKVRDAETEETTRLSLYGNAATSDNPMQSEMSSHIGAKGNCFCRKCNAGGTDKEKETDACFHSLFEPGTPRSKESILTELKKQVKLACSGVAQPIKNSQTETGIKDAYTQHWIDHILEQFKEKKRQAPDRTNTEIQEEHIQWTLDNEEKIYSGFLTLKGFDPTKDTPVEILHTILLGVVKYIWHSSHTSWNAAQKETYSLRLQSTNIDGLSVHPIRANYIMQYANSLIGRQFKTLAQTNVFHVHGLVGPEHFAIWRAVGELSALLWFPEIRDMKQYCDDVRTAIANVLDTFAVLDPTKILTKIKLHLLAHMPEDIVAFGPLLGVITEIYECFNAVFRFCSVLSNHLAPSRDIALQLADQEGLKHRLTGGWWPSKDSEGDWERAGPGVRGFLHTRPVLQKLVGWTVHDPAVAGSVKLMPLPKRGKGGPAPRLSQVLLSATNAVQALNCATYDMMTQWFECKHVIAASLDECKKGSWVFAKSPLVAEIVVGRIDNILDNGDGKSIVILDVFQVSATRDEIFGMPVLTRRHSEKTYLIIPALDVRFLFNVQHDCLSAGCTATGRRPRMQERVESGLTDKYIVCKPTERWIINTHAFHNAHLLRQALPRSLTAPVPLFADRKAKHDELAIALRETKNGKRKRAQEARAAKRKDREAKRQPQTKGKGKAGNPRKRQSKSKAAAGNESEREERDTGSDSDSSEDPESRPAPRKRRRLNNPEAENSESGGSDSDSDYGGPTSAANPSQTVPTRTSGRDRRPTAKAREGGQYESESE